MWVPIVYVPSEPGAALGQPRRDRALEPTPGPRELAPPSPRWELSPRPRRPHVHRVALTFLRGAFKRAWARRRET